MRHRHIQTTHFITSINLIINTSIPYPSNWCYYTLMFGLGLDLAIESSPVEVVGSNFPMKNRQSLDCNPNPENKGFITEC